jgi:hypothetical protein
MISKIENIVCIGEGLTPEEIHNRCRNGELKETRQIIMYFAHRLTRKTWKEIGDYFDLDHATAMHAFKTISNLVQTDREFRGKILKHENRLAVLELDRRVSYVNNTFKTLEFDALKLESKLAELINKINKIKEDIQLLDSGKPILNNNI